MTIEIKEKLTGSILDIGGGGEAVIGQIYKDRVTAIDNCKEELEEAPDCCSKQLMDATELSFPDDSFDNVTFFYTEFAHHYALKKERVLLDDDRKILYALMKKHFVL